MTRRVNKLDPERVREFFDYDPITGVMRWKKKRTKNKKANVGDVLSNINSNGYLKVQFDGKSIPVHRLIFAWMGEPDPEQVDHINGVRTDNRWANLRAATQEINSKNTARYKSGKHIAETGVGWMPRNKKWRVRINHKRKTLYLGLFDKLDDALFARRVAAKALGYHENHGRIPCPV